MKSEIEELYEVILLLKNITKTKIKLDLLKNLQKNAVAKDFFEKALHPKYAFGCKKIPEYRFQNEEYVCAEHESSYQNVINRYERLLDDKTKISDFMNESRLSMNADEYFLFSLILKKDPSCGVSVALVNKVWPGLIDTGVKLCKAEIYSKKNIKGISYPCIIQLKADGARCICKYDRTNDEIHFYSSSGKEYMHLDSLGSTIKSAINKLYSTLKTTSIQDVPSAYFDNGIIIDGELLYLEDDGTVAPRKTGNGILTKSLKNTISPAEASHVMFMVWDTLSYDEYNEVKGANKQKYYNRYLLTEALTEIAKSNHFQLIDTKIGNDFSDIVKEFKSKLNEGLEGVIVKNSNFLWKNDRVKDQIKFKLDFEVTLHVDDWKYGAPGTKYENCLGAIQCSSSDGKLSVSIGSGFSDPYRKEFVKKYKNTIPENMFIEVKSNGVIWPEEHETASLFLPRFAGERFDKTKADDMEMIMKLQKAKMNLEIM